MAAASGKAVFFLTVILQYFTMVLGQAFAENIPIGAIFDESSSDIRSAFGWEINTVNSNQNADYRVKLNANSQRTRVNDSFSLTTTMCSQMQNGIFVLFGVHRMATLSTMQSYTETFHMPFVTTGTAIQSAKELGYEVFMRPQYSKALFDIIRHYGWKRVHYVFDSEEGETRFQQLSDEIVKATGSDIGINLLSVEDAVDAYQTLNRLDAMNDEAKRIVLDMNAERVRQLLKLQEGDSRRAHFHYLLAEPIINEVGLDELFPHGGVNMTGLQLINHANESVRHFVQQWSQHRMGFLENRRNMISFESALAVDSVRLVAIALTKMMTKDPTIFRQTLRHGKFYNNGSEGIDCDAEPVQAWKHGHEIMKTMRDTEFWGLSGRIKFDNFGLRVKYKMNLLEVSLSRGLARIGGWSENLGLMIQSSQLVREQKGTNVVSNKTRIVTSILTAPYLMKKEVDETGKKLTGNDQYEGYCADVAQQIAQIVEFDYEIVPVKDGKYGSADENGTWNGMVGELIRHEADLAIAPLTITSLRERVIDFSKPFMSLGISIMIKKPTKEVPGVFSFMYPLSYEIWMCVIFAYIGVSVVLFLVSRFSPFEWHIEDNTDGPTVTNNFTIFNSLWFSLGAFMQQGVDIEPRSMSGRIVGSVWWFFTLIIISSYTANLAAFLTVERMQSPIESADDLAKQTEIKYGTVEGGSTMEFFKTSTIPVYERMWAFMSSAEPSVFVSGNEEGVKRVRESNGGYAFLAESTTNDYINQRKPCDTMKVGSNLDSKGYGIATPLGSDLRDRITLAVLTLREVGELQKLEKKWWYDLGECGKDQPKKKDATSALKLSNFAGIFYILVGGLVLALLMAVLEFVYKSNVEARRRQTSFGNAVKSKARLSIKGEPERQTTAYTYAPAAQLISLDGYADGNTHTQV